MTNTISAQEWLEVIKDEYLDGFVRDGGSSIKFIVPVKEALAPLIKTRLQEIGSGLDYLVVRVDSGDTRVHMPQEIFFRIAQQVDWRLLARRVVLRLSKDAGYLTDMIDPGPSHRFSRPSALPTPLRNPWFAWNCGCPCSGLSRRIQTCPGISGWQ